MSQENKNNYTFWADQAANAQSQNSSIPPYQAAADSSSMNQAGNQTNPDPNANYSSNPVIPPTFSNSQQKGQNSFSGQPDNFSAVNGSSIPMQNEQNAFSNQQNRQNINNSDNFAYNAASNGTPFSSYQTPPPVYPGYTNGAIPVEPPKKKSNKAAKKALKFVGSAALFGLVAGGTFLGFNKIYYHFNPESNPASSYSSNDLANQLQIPNQKTTLPTTTVSNNVSILETDVSAIVEKTMPATVAITSQFVTRNYFYGEYTQEGGGSGIIIGENDTEYLIATNNHVVENASEITIAFIDGNTAQAYIKGRDSAADLAVIAVKKDSISKDTKNAIAIATLGDSEEVKVGNMVIAIGNALGNGQSTTVGWISAKDREITNSDTGTTMTVLQTDAAINPGNSGGALLNMKGEVIGINSAKLTGTKIEGIGYAIPISKALPIVNDLMNREILTEDEKGYLGIQLSDVDITAEIAAAYNWPMGVYIKSVYPNSGSEKAGLMAGDIITAVNGVAITTRAQLQEKITSYRYGTSITITYSRFEDGIYKEYKTDVVLSSASVLNDSSNSSSSKNQEDASREDNNTKRSKQKDSGNLNPDTQDSNTQDPNTQVPDTQTPDAQDPNALDPNTLVPNTQDPNTQIPKSEDSYNPFENFFEDFFGTPFGR